MQVTIQTEVFLKATDSYITIDVICSNGIITISHHKTKEVLFSRTLDIRSWNDEAHSEALRALGCLHHALLEAVNSDIRS